MQQVNFQWRWGVIENSGASRSQIYTMPKAYYTAPSAAGEMGTAGEIGTGIMCPFFLRFGFKLKPASIYTRPPIPGIICCQWPAHADHCPYLHLIIITCSYICNRLCAELHVPQNTISDLKKNSPKRVATSCVD